ncbi:hypothetical protein V8C35DRAFT_276806 [Trichoderma chlorosporum]
MELYKIFGPNETGLVEIVGGELVRTAAPCPEKSAETLFQEALRDIPDHAPDFKLSTLTGCKLAECLSGKADGLQIIFGSAEGRKTVSDVYAVAPLLVEFEDGLVITDAAPNRSTIILEWVKEYYNVIPEIAKDYYKNVNGGNFQTITYIDEQPFIKQDANVQFLSIWKDENPHASD